MIDRVLSDFPQPFVILAGDGLRAVHRANHLDDSWWTPIAAAGAEYGQRGTQDQVLDPDCANAISYWADGSEIGRSGQGFASMSC